MRMDNLIRHLINAKENKMHVCEFCLSQICDEIRKWNELTSKNSEISNSEVPPLIPNVENEFGYENYPTRNLSPSRKKKP